MEDKKLGIRNWSIALGFKLALTLLHESPVSEIHAFFETRPTHFLSTW